MASAGMLPAARRATELGRARARLMGAGLAVSVRRVTEWHRRDRQKGTTWLGSDGEVQELLGALARARFVYEVVSSRVVMARFVRRYEADAFLEAFCARAVREVRGGVARLRAVRRVASLGALPDAA